MPSVRRSLVLSFAQKYTSLLIGIPGIMVLARFLTPAETGIFSVAIAFSNMAHMFRDFGVGAYLIQEHHLDREKLRSAFTITAIGAWLMALVLFLVAPVAARFYGQAGVASVLRVIALNFMVIPFGSPASSMMRRELAYGKLYIRNTAETASRYAASIALAVAGFSYMSLAWGSLAGITAGTIATMALRPRDAWLWPSLKHWRSVASFGHKVLIIDIFQQLAQNGRDMVLGRTLGFGATGLFSRGAGLVNMFQRNIHGAVSSVAFPAFAERAREGKDVGKLYAKSITYMTGVAWPFYIFAVIMAYPIILAAYGSQWIPAVPVLRLIAAGAAIGTLRLYAGQLQMATGHVKSRMVTTMIASPLRFALTIAAAFYSIEAVAAVSIIMAVVTIALQYWQLRRDIGLHFMTVLRASYVSAAIAATSNAVPVVVLVLGMTGRLHSAWVEVFAAAAGWGIGWLAGIFVFKHPLSTELLSAWERVHKRLYLRHSTNG